MDSPDLTVVGRLGRTTPEGFYQVNLKPDYDSVLEQVNQCFLIFNSDRVFFVTIEERKSVGNHSFIRFKEDGIDEEYRASGKVLVALQDEDLAALAGDTEITGLFGYQAIFEGKAIGTVDDAMLSTMQAVLLIRLEDGKELMVPYVPHFIAAINDAAEQLELVNISELLDICTSMS